MASSQKTSLNKTWYWVQCLAAAAGLALSLYLLIQHTRLKSGIQGSASFCNFGKYANCDVVNTSEWSEVAGIPVAGFGALLYFLCLVSSLIAQPGTKGFRRSQWLLMWLATLALAADGVLFVVQILLIRNFCLFCLSTYVCTGLLFWSALRLSEKRGVGLFQQMKELLPLRSIAGTGHLSNSILVIASLGTACFGVLLFLVPTFVRTASPTSVRVEDAMAQYIESWKKLPVKNIEYKDGDGSQGNAASRVRVVVFSDFQCPFCKKAAFTMNTALSNLKDRVFFIFKHFPLDSSCNPALQYQLHQHACQLAYLGYCARAKGKFWEYHDRVFFNLTESDLEKGMEKVTAALTGVLSPTEISQCLESSQARGNVEADIKLGNSLGIKGTPSVFINGKPVTIPLTVENLEKLIALEENPGS